MDDSTNSDGLTRKNLEKLDPTSFLSGWAERANAEDAAVLIQVFRDKPELLKTSMGIKAHKLAVSKVKGTEWESILFEDNKPDKTLSSFRAECDRIEAGQEERKEQELKERKEKSLIYLAEVKRLKAERDNDNNGGAA